MEAVCFCTVPACASLVCTRAPEQVLSLADVAVATLTLLWKVASSSALAKTPTTCDLKSESEDSFCAVKPAFRRFKCHAPHPPIHPPDDCEHCALVATPNAQRRKTVVCVQLVGGWGCGTTVWHLKRQNAECWFYRRELIPRWGEKSNGVLIFGRIFQWCQLGCWGGEREREECRYGAQNVG